MFNPLCDEKVQKKLGIRVYQKVSNLNGAGAQRHKGAKAGKAQRQVGLDRRASRRAVSSDANMTS